MASVLSERRRAKRFLTDVIFAETQEPFTGYVERRDPSTYQQRSLHLTWRCTNPYCREWTMKGSYLSGRCCFCQTRRGE